MDEIYISDQESNNSVSYENEHEEEYIETVETISVTLVTTRLFRGQNLISERRNHQFESSIHFDPRSLDWSNFF